MTEPKMGILYGVEVLAGDEALLLNHFGVVDQWNDTRKLPAERVRVPHGRSGKSRLIGVLVLSQDPRAFGKLEAPLPLAAGLERFAGARETFESFGGAYVNAHEAWGSFERRARELGCFFGRPGLWLVETDAEE